MKTFKLYNGVEIPAIGYGTWRTRPAEVCEKAVYEAIEVGYTHIDGAAIYKNEESVGKAIQKSNIQRKNLFVTSKVWNDMRGYEKTKEAFYTSLEKLGLDYLDLYLIHWPNPLAFRDKMEEMNAETWRAMEDLYMEGKIKAIGVSNFKIHHLESLMKNARIKPMVNQIECTIGFIQQDVIDYCHQNDILVEGWSPLGNGKLFNSDILNDYAYKYNKSIAQITLRYLLQKKILPLPKSTNKERMKQNMDIFDFEISKEDMDAIDALKINISSGNDPDEVEF